MKIVFDTNVLFAAFVARNGLCAKIVEEGLAGHEIFLSQFILSEFARCLEQKAGIDKTHIENAIESLVSVARIVVPAQISANVIRDHNDTAILGTALASHADALVSGDKDLLILGSFETIPIVSPRQFFDRFLSERR
ncbi:MAG TPA: putative toxin-antitoxin system toxin component, PIN family [Tepidisphaeraceae bacterium]|jgi:putative PIN family toxin of toxin-antitoxin system|nr:putative toxin-antitoxin system toxin component, PIN family [Tepidisphaeraceae bacterium]